MPREEWADLIAFWKREWAQTDVDWPDALRGAYADNLGWQHAGDALLMTVLGGVHHFLGPLWGAIAFILLEDRLSAVTESWWLIFAPIVILFALASPEGMQGLLFRLIGPATEINRNE